MVEPWNYKVVLKSEKVVLHHSKMERGEPYMSLQKMCLSLPGWGMWVRNLTWSC